jgi:hypothetical protein
MAADDRGLIVVVVAALARTVVVLSGTVVLDGETVVFVAGLDEEVSVKTRTTSRIGLDHMSRCVLFSDDCIRAIGCEG